MNPTVVFDLDGTLVETLPDIHAATNRMLAAEGRRGLGLEETRLMVGGGARSLVVDAFAATGAAGSDDAIDAAFARLVDFYEAHPARHSTVFPGVFEALETLSKAGHPLAVCTNKPGRLTALVLEAFGLDRYFAAVIAGDTLATRKPDAEPVRESIVRAGGDPARAIFVGDSPTDAAAARAAVLPFVAVSFGYSPVPAGDLAADIVIDRFDRLTGAIDMLSQR